MRLISLKNVHNPCHDAHKDRFTLKTLQNLKEGTFARIKKVINTTTFS